MRKSDAGCRRKKISPPALEAEMITALIRRKEEYERYFSTKEDIDPKVEQAFTNIVKLIIELARGQSGPEKSDPEEMKRAAEEILEREYGIKRN